MDTKIRFRVVETLAEVLKMNPSMYSTNRPLFDFFLSKNDDNNAEIRQLVVRGCDTILEYHTDSNNQIFRT